MPTRNFQDSISAKYIWSQTSLWTGHIAILKDCGYINIQKHLKVYRIYFFYMWKKEVFIIKDKVEMFYIYCMILSLLYSIQYMLATYSQHNIIEYSHKLCKNNHLWYCLKILHFIKYIKTKSTIPILTFSPIFPQRNISLYLISALHNRSLMFHSQFNAHI